MSFYLNIDGVGTDDIYGGQIKKLKRWWQNICPQFAIQISSSSFLRIIIKPNIY